MRFFRDDMTKSDDKKFNETLREMLKTPPKHHKDEKKGGKKPANKSAKRRVKDVQRPKK